MVIFKNGEVSEQFLKEKANFYFIEHANGLYEVVKDRFCDVGEGEIVTNLTVTQIFNENEKVVVKRVDNNFISDSNFKY
jgi:hypothetical protein